MATVHDILERKGHDVVAIDAADTVLSAARRMNERGIGGVVVMDGGTMVGIFTERDVLVRVVAERLDPDATPIRQVMTSPLVAIGPDQTVEDAMVIITKRRCRHLPVMDGNDLLGMVSIGDITRSLISHQKAEIQDLVSYITWG